MSISSNMYQQLHNFEQLATKVTKDIFLVRVNLRIKIQ